MCEARDIVKVMGTLGVKLIRTSGVKLGNQV